MSSSGASVSGDCITAYNNLKTKKDKLKFIIFKLSDDSTEIVIEETSTDTDWEAFRQKLLDAKHKTKFGEGPGPRYAVYDFSYSVAGEGDREKLCFIAWSPDEANVKAKMVYAASKVALRDALSGFAAELQANDKDDLEYDSVLKAVSRGKAA